MKVEKENEMENTEKKQDEPVVVTLSTPVEHGNEILTEFQIRPIRTKDIIDLGNIYILGGAGGDTSVDISMKRCAAYIARLAAVPPSVVSRLSVADFMKCQEVVLNFFGQSGAQTPAT